jgi:mevalonate kinase
MFETFVPGKWVLTGEHAVLRGAAAIALPHPEYGLRFQAEMAPESHFEPETMEPVLQKLFSLSAELLGRSDVPSVGIRVHNAIPLGAGLGSSAALCVAVTRFLSAQGWINREKIAEHATRLEDHFHGKSSGMDVAATHAGRPILFTRGQAPEPLELSELPTFTFHDTGLRMETKKCIAQVQELRERDPVRAEILDQRMCDAGAQALQGLKSFARGEHEAGLALLSQAMSDGQSCFEEWGLMPESAVALKRKLLDDGARAVKLTGAGGGGYLVALRG